MREDTPTKNDQRLKDSLRKRESRAREHSLTRLSRQSQDATSRKAWLDNQKTVNERR